MNELIKVATSSSIDKDLQTLLKSQLLGVYNCVEVTEIFAITKKGEPPLNIFSLMVAENRNLETINLNNESYVTPRKGITVPYLKDWYIGIKTYLISLDKALEMFTHVEKNQEWDSCGKKIKTSEYDYRKRTFTPPDSFHRVPLNSLLKNNFNNGSYVVELINKHKSEFSVFFETPSLLQDLTDEILNYLPIDISSLSDRLGNIIFQIPVKAIQASIRPKNDSEDLQCKVAWHPDVKKRELMVCGRQEDEDFNQNDFGIVSILKESQTCTIPFEHAGAYRLVIWDYTNELILSLSAPTAFIKSFGFSSNVSGGEQRVIYNADGSSSIVPIVVNTDTRMVGKNTEIATDWTKIRIYENSRGKLKDNREFIQYNPKGRDKLVEHNKALEDIRYLINAYGKNGAFLWDPYLSPQDIVETLFHSKFSNSDLRAISALKEPPVKPIDKSMGVSVFDRYHDEFESFSAEMMVGINLQFRSPRNHHGWNFHDRFIIFPDVDNLPLAWSLGTSVNSFGQEHHILQKCSDSRLILDAFSELWAELEVNECLVWGTK